LSGNLHELEEELKIIPKTFPWRLCKNAFSNFGQLTVTSIFSRKMLRCCKKISLPIFRRWCQWEPGGGEEDEDEEEE
jgi:hypothetical protein